MKKLIFIGMLSTLTFSGFTQLIEETATNVGIGTNTPSEGLLHIYRNATTGGWGTINTSNAGLRIQDNSASLFIDGNTLYTNSTMNIGTITNSYFTIGTSDSERVRITASGDVGIGTSSPSEKLHLKNGGTLFEMDSEFGNDPKILFQNDGDGANPYQTFYRWTGGSNNYYATRFLHAGNSGFKIQVDNSTVAYGQHTFKDAMTILRSGNVGIGASTPTEKLHIKDGGTLFEMDSKFGSDPRILFQNDEDGANPYQTFYRWTGSSSNYFATRFLHSGSDGFKIQVDNSAVAYGTHTFQDVMTILRSGNIGIGTSTTGSHRLAVEGSIGAREIKVEASGWSDYVFENDYELRTLEEVENYITENNHLPEIPSEAEVTEKGINLGEMDAKLLQKIEELTLYMIELNKQMKSHTDEIEHLKAENSELTKGLSAIENK